MASGNVGADALALSVFSRLAGPSPQLVQMGVAPLILMGLKNMPEVKHMLACSAG